MSRYTIYGDLLRDNRQGKLFRPKSLKSKITRGPWGRGILVRETENGSVVVSHQKDCQIVDLPDEEWIEVKI